MWGYNNVLGVAPFQTLKVVDVGDADVVPVDIVATHRGIRDHPHGTERVFDVYDDDTWVYPGHGKDTTLGAGRPHLEEWRARGW